MTVIGRYVGNGDRGEVQRLARISVAAEMFAAVSVAAKDAAELSSASWNSGRVARRLREIDCDNAIVRNDDRGDVCAIGVLEIGEMIAAESVTAEETGAKFWWRISK